MVTGNGDFDGKLDFGESVVRLRYTPASPGAGASIKVTGSWTPWTDDGRTGGNPEGEGAAATAAILARFSAHPMPSNFRIVPHLARLGFRAEEMASGAWSDQDVGASGIVLVEKSGIALVSSKDGILYTINLNSPGKTRPPTLRPPRPRPTTPSWRRRRSCIPTSIPTSIRPRPSPQTLNRLLWQRDAPSSRHAGLLAECSARPDALLRRRKRQSASVVPGRQQAFQLPRLRGRSGIGRRPVPPGGMPGWSIFLSANGNNDGVVWAMIPYGDANMKLTNGRLLAYDAANLANFADGSGEIVPLWDSQDWNWNFLHPKFNRPIAVDGKVIVPTYNGQVLVLGLA